MADLTEQVLAHFRERFLKVMDAKAIVMELENHEIISNGDQTEIRRETNSTQQNQLLHACLKKKCTVEALMIVCDIITKVNGNPRLKSLGEDMKTELEKGPGSAQERGQTAGSVAEADSDTGPMEEWNRDALVSLQENLKLKVRVQPGLVNKLQKAAGGFMSDAEAQAVMSKQSNAEQMGELIQILLGKSNRDFKIFCKMLRQSNYDIWANELGKKAREFKGEPADEPPPQPEPPHTDVLTRRKVVHRSVDYSQAARDDSGYSEFVPSQTKQPSGSDQGEPTLQQSKRHCGRCPASVVGICLAVLIASVGVVVCLLPWPFTNDWQDQICPAIPLPWLWRHGGMYTDLIQVSELHTNLTKEDLRCLQSVGQNDLVWVEIGITGVGKSTLGNFLLGKDAFKAGSGLNSVTEKAEVDCSAVNNQRMCIVDTPGFGDTRRMLTKNTEAENLAGDAAHLIVELSKTMLMAQHGIDAFFVVVRADSRELFSTMKLLDLLDILGNYWNHSILVFTHGKEFDKASEERQYAEFAAILESPSCPDVWQALMKKVSNRYVIVEPEEWKDDKEYRLRKLTEFRKHTSRIVANSGHYNDTLHSLVREYIETAKLELRHEFSDVGSPEPQVAALQVAFKNIISMLCKLIRIKLAGGVDTELLQKMAIAKEEQLTKVRKQRDLLYEQLLKEQEEKRRAQTEEEKAREEERKAKERERAMAEERGLALERAEKARKELEEYLKKPTFAERRIETEITRSGFYKRKYVHTAEAVDVATGIRAKAQNYKSEGGAKEHARANLKAILLEQGIIRKD